jgi:hypothetical protein
MQLKHWPTHLLRHAVACLGLAGNLYVTAWEPTTEPSEAAPARALRSADISALLPQVGLPTLHVRQHQREVSQLSLRGHVLTPIRPVTDRPWLAPSSFTRRPIGSPCGSLSLAGRRRAYHVPPMSPCGLGRISPPVARHLRRGSSEPPVLTTYLLVQAYQHLALGITYGVYRCFTWVDRATPSWSPTALMLAVAPQPRGVMARPEPEDTLSRELRTPPLPETHVPVGYCWQNSRCGRSEECRTATSTTSCRTRTGD